MSKLDELISGLENYAREVQVPPAVFKMLGEISREAKAMEARGEEAEKAPEGNGREESPATYTEVEDVRT